MLASLLPHRIAAREAQELADDDLDWAQIMQKHAASLSSVMKDSSGVLTSEEGEDKQGELAVDVWHDTVTYYIRTAIAGVEPENLDITVSNDTVGIAGARPQPSLKPGQNALASECHWGRFGRTIILPSEINPAEVSAQLKNGILLITAPKLKTEGTFRIPVMDESVMDDAFGAAK